MSEPTSEITRLVPRIPAAQGIQMPNLSPPPRQQRRAPGAGLPKGPFIKYVGPCTRRIIRPHHWHSKLGKENVKDSSTTHEWSSKNKKLIPVSSFSDAQLDYLLIDDMQARGGHSFVVVDYNDAGQLVEAELPAVNKA